MISYITLAFMLRRIYRMKRNIKRSYKTKGYRLLCRQLKQGM